MRYATITGKKQKNANSKVYFIILAFLLVKLYALYIYKTIWWDASVYIGMGKYIYSLGNSGLWENSRPIVWPLILGFFWKTGLNYVILGRIAEIIFGSLCILLTYLIGKRIFDEKIGMLAAFFLAISPTFFFFSGIMLTETASTFFALLALYFLIDGKHFFSGISFGLAFMARFLQLFAFAAAVLALIYNKQNAKTFQKTFLGFAAAVFPYLALSQILYQNPFFPFFQQVFLTANSGWLNHEQISYYFIELFKENFIYILFIPGIFLSFKKAAGRLVIFPLALLLFFFNAIKQKEMRFLIILLPYMYLLASYVLIHFAELKKFMPVLICSLLFFSAIKTSSNLASESGKANQYAVLQGLLEKSNGSIWVSSPIIAAESDKRISRLIYYPFFGRDLKELMKESEKADFIFIDMCDLGCRPSDAKCGDSKKEIISFFRQKFKEAYSRQGECPQFAFQA